jgi:hypothetical protein
MKQKSSLFIVVVLAAVTLSGLLSIGSTNNVFAQCAKCGQGTGVGHGPGANCQANGPCIPPPPPPPPWCTPFVCYDPVPIPGPGGQGPGEGHGPGGFGG